MRLLTVFGYDHAPHGHAEVSFDNVRNSCNEHVALAKVVDLKLRRAVLAQAEFIIACAASVLPSVRWK